MPRHKESGREHIRHNTRRRLLDAATTAFAAEGYERAGVDAISQAAGYAKGTIYNYFDSKRALMLALIAEIAVDHLAWVAAEVEGAAQPAERLLRFFEAGFDWVQAYPRRARLMLNTLNGADVEFRQAMFTAYQPMFTLIGRSILGPGMARGQFRNLHTGPTAGLLMLVYLGASSQQDPQGRPWMPASQVADLVLYGLMHHEATS